MTGDDRGLGNSQRVSHRGRRNVRDIHQHSQPVHLLDNPFAKRRQSVVPGHIGGGIGPVERGVVRQRHVPGAQRIKCPELGEAVFNGHAPFDPHERRDLPGGVIRSTSAAE